MAQLKKTRDGWQSENLARFILHDFAFIAEPSNIANDIKIDFFCTLFDLKAEDNIDLLFPKNSFAIQIKSNNDLINITDDISFFNSLEIPYFVGVVNKEEKKLSIYSGEYLQLFFSYKSLDCELKIKLIARKNISNIDECFEQVGENRFNLYFPLVCDLLLTDSNDDRKIKLQRIKKVNLLIMHNISLKNNSEYIFSLFENPEFEKVVFSGSGSNRVFRENFLYSLTEVFSNLSWIRQNSPEDFNLDEYKIYDSLYKDLQELGKYKYFPRLLIKVHEQLSNRLAKK